MDRSANIPEMILARARFYKDREAFLYKRNGTYVPMSWEAVAAHIRHFALGLAALGISKGDKIALISENRPEWAIVDLGMMSLGAVHVPIFTTSSPEDVEYILNHSEAKILIVSTEALCARVLPVCGRLPGIRKIIVMHPGELKKDGNMLLYDDLINLGRRIASEVPEAFEGHLRTVKREDLATIIYTSGTTGEPKGVMLTHENFLSNIEASAEVLDVRATDRALSFLPLSHVFERMAGYYFMLHQGASIAYAEDMNKIGENMLEAMPTVMTAVPRFFEKMHARIMEQIDKGPALRKKAFFWGLTAGKQTAPLRMSGQKIPFGAKASFAIARELFFKKIRQKLGGRMRFFISGGAPLSREIAEFFFAADVLILQGYGLTETSPVISVNLTRKNRFGTVGPILPNVRVKIAADGEILVKGPSVMKCYFKSEEQTRLSFDDGWFLTGDIGELDGEGFLKITDRKKDIIVTSAGKNIAPQKIENALIADECVSQICVIGDRRNYLTALVVPDWQKIEEYAKLNRIDPSNREDLARDDRIIGMMGERIGRRTEGFASHERIKYFTLLSKEFTVAEGELTATMKVKRKFIAEKYRSLIDLMYPGKSFHEQILV